MIDLFGFRTWFLLLADERGKDIMTLSTVYGQAVTSCTISVKTNLWEVMVMTWPSGNASVHATRALNLRLGLRGRELAIVVVDFEDLDTEEAKRITREWIAHYETSGQPGWQSLAEESTE